MRYVILVNSKKPAKSNLWDIKQPNTYYILITETTALAQYQESQLNFFDKIHIISSITPALLLDALAPYLNLKLIPRTSLQLLTAEESCLLSVAAVREQLGLSGAKVDELLPFIDKVVMKQRLAQSDIRYPRYCLFDKPQYQYSSLHYLQELINTIGFPMIAKPINLSGSRSVCYLNNQLELETWAQQIIHDDYTYEIDEFIDGTLYHCDSIIKDGKVVYFSAGECLWPCLYFSQGYNLGSIHLEKNSPLELELAQYNANVIAQLAPPDGCTHMEVFINQLGEKIFLEIAARPPGAHVSIIHALTTGIDYETEYFKVQLGLTLSTEQDRPAPKHYYAWIYLPKLAGEVIVLQQPDIASQFDSSWFIQVGEQLQSSQHGSTRSEIAGQIIYYHADPAQLYQDFKKLKHFQGVQVKTSNAPAKDS